MNIAHLIFSLNTGGTETMLVDILNRQSESHSVALFIINDQVNEGLLQQISGKVKVVRLNRKEGARNPMPLLRLNRALWRFDPEVIHCHNHKAVNMLRLSLRKKALLTLHTTNVPVTNLKKYAKLFAISRAVQTDVHNRSGLSTQVIYNGVDFDAVVEKKGPADPAVFRIVQVGRLDHEVKGQHILLEALKILKEQGHNHIRLDFIGEGVSTLHLVQLRAALGLDDVVRFLGARDRKYIYQHLQDYNLLVQPSFVEGFGLTIVEAIAAGLHVLVSDLDGPMEIIRAAQRGDYFKTGDSRSLAGSINAILERKVETTIPPAAKLYVRQNFDIAHTVNHYLNAYKTLK
ncbi:glycosyltransferase [Taibaiella helva]|uniref:glycosyltransferase n=1 Tax=Taibaiella helva TaxID=2301235 RepID=UPI000E598374|nr:glycosyltransferase [Taibaiella helva]